MKKLFKNYILPAVHIFIIILAYMSPWFIPWELVLIVFVLYRLQFVIFKNCILSIWQFSTTPETFWYHYIRKVFPRVNKKIVDFITDWILPAGAVVLAFIIQHS